MMMVGDVLGFSIEGPSQAKIDCHDNGDGSANITYFAFAPGEYAVHVLCDDEDIQNSPWMADIVPASDQFDPSKVRRDRYSFGEFRRTDVYHGGRGMSAPRIWSGGTLMQIGPQILSSFKISSTGLLALQCDVRAQTKNTPPKNSPKHSISSVKFI